MLKNSRLLICILLTVLLAGCSNISNPLSKLESSQAIESSLVSPESSVPASSSGEKSVNSFNETDENMKAETYYKYAQSCIDEGELEKAREALEKGIKETGSDRLLELLETVKDLQKIEGSSSSKASSKVKRYQAEEPFNKQIVEVSTSGSSATLTLSEWNDGEWNDIMETNAAIGSKGITEYKVEGDRKTPAGTFDILFYFGLTEYNSDLSFYRIHEGDYWVCNPDSAYYNTLQSTYTYGTGLERCENMYTKFTGGSSTACIAFDFNGDCRSYNSADRGGGSAIFIDGVGSDGDKYSGYGDIKISSGDMKKLIKELDSDKNPVITIK